MWCNDSTKHRSLFFILENMMLTQTQMNNLPPIDNQISAAYDDDDIRELGNCIANLTLIEAKELHEYLAQNKS
jgi:hypothetical protein